MKHLMFYVRSFETFCKKIICLFVVTDIFSEAYYVPSDLLLKNYWKDFN